MVARHRPRGAVGAVVGVVMVVVLGVGAMVAAGSGGDGSSRSDSASTVGDTDATGSTTTITAPPPAPEAFGQAAQRLRDAGSFGYAGAARASDVSHARPMLWLAVESTIEGQVDTATGKVHEVAVATDGTTSETVTDGPLVWGRKAPAVESLPDEAYQSVPGLSGDELPVKGMARLPEWLAAAADPLDAGADGQGRRLYQATVPAEVLGVIERERAPVGATVLLTLDDAGDPVRVELTSAPGGPTFHLVFDVTGLGEPVAITPPGQDTSA
jgi:hypothetical protein